MWRSDCLLCCVAAALLVSACSIRGSEEALPACTHSMVRHVDTDCSGHSGLKKLIYFFDQACDETNTDSVTLPKPATVPCQCAPGRGVSSGDLECTDCEAGYYGPGGRVLDSEAWGQWTRCPSGLYSRRAAIQMSTFCETGNLTVVTSIHDGSACQPWRPGPPLPSTPATPGPLEPSYCDGKNQEYRGNHDYLISGVQPRETRVLSVLHTVVEIIQLPAFIEFTFFVDTQPCFSIEDEECDGLTFYIDNDETMTKKSQQLTWETQKYSIDRVGFHSLRWHLRVSDIDDPSQYTVSNQAALRSIILVGVEGNSTCAACPPGSYSPSANSSACTPCPEFYFQNVTGQTHCVPCDNDTYSLKGGVQCYKLRMCESDDLIHNLTAISTCTRNSSGDYVRNESVRWLHHVGYSQPLCDTDAVPPSVTQDTQVQCRCQPGQEFLNVASNKPECINCIQRWHSSDGLSCRSCPSGSVTHGERTIRTWSELPDGFASTCLTSNDQKWTPNGNSLRTGYTMDSYDLQLLWDNITIVGENGGYLEFDCSVDCSLDDDSSADHHRALPIDPIAPAVAFTSHCHLEFRLFDKDGLHEPIECSPRALRNGTVMRHHIKLTAGQYRFIWYYHQLDIHFAQSIGMEGRIHRVSVVGLDSTLGGASRCQACPAGYHQNADQSSCTACPTGTYSSSSSTNCTMCPPGTISTKNMSSSCEQCAPGTYSKTPTSCAACSPGTYAPGGTGTCFPCQVGFFSDKYGMCRCLPCGPGTSNSDDFTACDYKQCHANLVHTTVFNDTTVHQNYTYDFSKLGGDGDTMLAVDHLESDTVRFYINLCKSKHRDRHCLDQNKQPINSMVCMEECHPPGSTNCTVGKSFGHIMGWEYSGPNNISITVNDEGQCDETVRIKSARIQLLCNSTEHTGTPQLVPEMTDDYHAEFIWHSKYACPMCSQNCFKNVSSGCRADGSSVETTYMIQPCWGSNMTGNSTSVVTKCITIYVVIGGTVAFSLFIFIIFYVVRSQHLKAQASRSKHSLRMQEKLVRMSSAGEMDGDLIDSEYEEDMERECNRQNTQQESGNADSDDELLN